MKKTFILFLFIVIKGTAQQLTLQDAINITLKNSFDIQIAKNNVEVSKINNHIGVAGGLPTVTGTISDQESLVNINQELNTGTKLTRNGAKSNNLNANITGTMLLYNGHRVVTTKKRLEELQKQSEQELNVQIQNTIAAVMVRYYDAVRQSSYIRTLEQSIDLSKQRLQLIQTRKDIGMANDADIFQAQIDLNTRQQDLQTQQLVMMQATADLLTVMNVRPDSVITIKDTIIVDGDITLPDVLNSIKQNPSVLSADNQIKINELIEKETAAQRYPSLRGNLGLNYGRNQANGGQLLLNQTYGPFVSVGLTVPLYNGSTLKRQQQTTAIGTQNARLQKDNLLQGLQNNTVKTYQSYVANRQQMKSQQQNFELSEKLMSLTMKRFELAAATIIEVREAQKSFEDAGYRLINLSYAAKIAEIELKRIANKLGL